MKHICTYSITVSSSIHQLDEQSKILIPKTIFLPMESTSYSWPIGCETFLAVQKNCLFMWNFLRLCYSSGYGNLPAFVIRESKSPTLCQPPRVDRGL